MKSAVAVLFISCIVVFLASNYLQVGCGTLFHTGPSLLGWHVLAAIVGPAFADSRPYIVLLLGAILSSMSFSVIVWVLALALRRQGALSSRSGVFWMFTIAVVLYFVLITYALPLDTCP